MVMGAAAAAVTGGNGSKWINLTVPLISWCVKYPFNRI